jgi:2-keto-4-pentenoate hydratase/2-oxohepta-3-ene-1,7-dioic acid hydratase in catechol pathway
MKLCRFQPLEFGASRVGKSEKFSHPEPRTGLIAGERVRELAGETIAAALGEGRETGREWPLAEVKLLPPSAPTKIVCIGRNYREHAAELGNELPKEPLIFLKPPSAVIAPEEPIVLTPLSKRVDYEGELAVVIGRECHGLAPNEDVMPYIAGYTCLNDVTARDLQIADVQFTRSKSFDTFCPFGPVLETELDLGAVTVETYVNGKRKQSAPVSEMIFSVDVIIRWIAQVMTLLPGDVVATGTPVGVGPLAAGDVVEVVVSGVGTLRNPVMAPEV